MTTGAPEGRDRSAGSGTGAPGRPRRSFAQRPLPPPDAAVWHIVAFPWRHRPLGMTGDDWPSRIDTQSWPAGAVFRPESLHVPAPVVTLLDEAPDALERRLLKLGVIRHGRRIRRALDARTLNLWRQQLGDDVLQWMRGMPENRLAMLEDIGTMGASRAPSSANGTADEFSAAPRDACVIDGARILLTACASVGPEWEQAFRCRFAPALAARITTFDDRPDIETALAWIDASEALADSTDFDPAVDPRVDLPT